MAELAGTKSIPLPLRSLELLTDQYGTPYQLYDERSIRGQAKKLITTFAYHFPGFKQFFAVKALPNPAILSILVKAGCGLDCSSAVELQIARSLGVSGQDIMFTSNYTSVDDLRMALDCKAIINLDDASLVQSLMDAGDGRVPELICFRVNPGLGNTSSETQSNVLGGPDAKFGVARSQIIDAYRLAQQKGCTRFGLHMMTGSCVMDNNYWLQTVEILLDIALQLYSELRVLLEFINIGGGLGIPYKPDERAVDVDGLAHELSRVFSRKMRQLEQSVSPSQPFTAPRLYMENGRFLTGPFGWLVSRCHAVKRVHSQPPYYGLDACMANLMRPGMYGSYHHISVPAREGGKVIPSHVVGTLCENNDWFAKDRPLPEAAVGDLFVIHDTGAHSHSMGFQYNGKLRAPEVVIREPEDISAAGVCVPVAGGRVGVDLVRRRETLADYVATVVMPPNLRRPLDARMQSRL